jgi:lysophospholipase L1-like esterase
MGTNGIVTPEDLRPILDELTEQQRVVVVNVSVPRSWMKASNKEIAKAIADRPNVRLADWATIAKGHRKWFTPDGVHLNNAGGQAFAELIVKTLEAP